MSCSWYVCASSHVLISSTILPEFFRRTKSWKNTVVQFLAYSYETGASNFVWLFYIKLLKCPKTMLIQTAGLLEYLHPGVYIRCLWMTGISAIAKTTAYEGRAFCKEHESCRIISGIKQLKFVTRLDELSAKCSCNALACISAYICSQYTRFSSKIQTKVVTLYMVILKEEH